MNWANDATSWRESFVAALNVLAQAAARLPVGVLDPALSGASAVELYTGGLWSTRDVELLCDEARPLIIELFTAGFRWTTRSQSVRRVLWHPELQVRVDLAERREPLGGAEQANALVVAVDLRSTGQAGSEPLSLKVVGIEDLIVRLVVGWLRDGAVSGEAAAKLQTLVGLAREGVGGPLRAGYLQRRLASETYGEVVFESPSVEADGELTPQLRRTSLTQMQGVIRVWRARCGLSVARRSLRGEFGKDGAPPRVVMNRTNCPQRGGEWAATTENVIALDDARPVPPD